MGSRADEIFLLAVKNCDELNKMVSEKLICFDFSLKTWSKKQRLVKSKVFNSECSRVRHSPSPA